MRNFPGTPGWQFSPPEEAHVSHPDRIYAENIAKLSGVITVNFWSWIRVWQQAAIFKLPDFLKGVSLVYFTVTVFCSQRVVHSNQDGNRTGALLLNAEVWVCWQRKKNWPSSKAEDGPYSLPPSWLTSRLIWDDAHQREGVTLSGYIIGLRFIESSELLTTFNQKWVHGWGRSQVLPWL